MIQGQETITVWNRKNGTRIVVRHFNWALQIPKFFDCGVWASICKYQAIDTKLCITCITSIFVNVKITTVTHGSVRVTWIHQCLINPIPLWDDGGQIQGVRKLPRRKKSGAKQPQLNLQHNHLAWILFWHWTCPKMHPNKCDCCHYCCPSHEGIHTRRWGVFHRYLMRPTIIPRVNGTWGR